MNLKLRRFFGSHEDEGQALIFFAILMLALLFAVGLAIDAGQLYTAKRTEQEAADAAAFAGAVVIYQGGVDVNGNLLATVAQIKDAARADAQTNGYIDAPAGCTTNCTTKVEINYPPLSGAYIGNTRHVEVIITRQVPTSLVPAEAVFNPVRARGVAGAEPLNNGYAIMALDKASIDRGFWAQGPNGNGNGSEMHLHGGGILVNSGSGNAGENDQIGAGKITTDGFPLDVHGNATGHWGDLTPPVPVNAGHNQVPDPFAGFPKPSVCLATQVPPCAPVTPVYTSLPGAVGGVVTLDPGVYKVKIKGAGNDNFHLNPGIYILEAGLDTSGNALFEGSNVFVYNAYTTYPAAPGASPSCSDVQISGNGAITLTAMTTGTWKNMLFYQDPACTNDFEIAGNGNFDGTGSFYLPSALFMMDGNNATLHGSQLVAQQVQVQNGKIDIDYDPVTTAQPILPRLAE